LFAQSVSEIFNLCGHDPPTSQLDGQTDRQTDGQTTCDRKTALYTIVHHAVNTWQSHFLDFQNAKKIDRDQPDRAKSDCIQSFDINTHVRV